MNRRKLFAAMALALIVAFAGLAAFAESPEEIAARGVLRVGTAGDYQPMSFLAPGTGEYAGFDAVPAEKYICGDREDGLEAAA